MGSVFSACAKSNDSNGSTATKKAPSAYLPSFTGIGRTRALFSPKKSTGTAFIQRSDSESIEKARSANVTIVSLRASDVGLVTGEIYVRNLAYEKKVTVRYTMDGWATHSEMPAVFSRNVDEEIDAFGFILALPKQNSGKCELCVCYSVADAELWDNNEGANYALDQAASEKKQ
ncbi:hypothetical protein PENTCL1PPCAC_8749 [Pristionchus entomophagus]|uniref:CBM21 domain-containing protein n=1 Tax=Pristionchus entomophagus TaxID=358040 RepID=A0AAV5T219_9BILA|nr:hypothetical protein PENTCL1PPCAC_8749 [Pristionchus entomophagus]